MAKSTITPEEGAELEKLYGEREALYREAIDAIIAGGMSSAAFIEADRKAGAVTRRIKELLGALGQHWMST